MGKRGKDEMVIPTTMYSDEDIIHFMNTRAADENWSPSICGKIVRSAIAGFWRREITA